MDMIGRLDFNEALKDSPRFRQGLHKHEQYLRTLEFKVRDIIRLTTTMVEFGKSYVASFYNVMSAVNEISSLSFGHDPLMINSFGTIAAAYEEIIKFQKVLVEQAHWTIIKNLNDFIKRDLGKFHEQHQHFERMSQSLDEALVKNSQVNRKYTKIQEANDTRNELLAIGTCFAHTSLDYVFQVNMVQANKNHELLQAFASFLRSCQTYFHQGHDYFGTWEQPKTSLDDALKILKQKSHNEERRHQDRHMLVPKEVFQHPTGMPQGAHVFMEGYLFKRATNALKTWNRRWFLIRDNQLLYCHRLIDQKNPQHPQKITDDGYTVMEPDLRLCLVRPAPPAVERHCCFELVTPTKSHVLQADSESLCNAWMKALQRSIESALHDEVPNTSMSALKSTFDRASESSSVSESSNEGVVSDVQNGVVRSKSKRVLHDLRSVPGNDFCADCGSPNPKWASINLGVTLCIECCGIHRGMGVQVSKVRSMTLDAWETEHVNIMKQLGNQVVNEAYLAYLPETPIPPAAKPNSTRAARQAWIKAKYVDRRFSHPSAERAQHAARIAQMRHDRLRPKTRTSKDNPATLDNRKVLRRRRKRVSKMLFLTLSTRVAHTMTAAATRSSSVSVKGPELELEAAQLLSLRKISSSDPCLNNPEIERPVSMPPENIAEKKKKRLSCCGSEAALDALSDTEIAPECEAPSPADSAVHERELLVAARKADLAGICRAFARGADVNCHCCIEEGGDTRTTPMHQAILASSLETSEYLLLNCAKINTADSELQTPLHLAAIEGCTGQVCQLLKRGAIQELRNSEQKTPLEIAVASEHADIVTLLRLAKLREEINETEPINNPMEETVLGVFEDISQMASNRPQMLKREPSERGSNV